MRKLFIACILILFSTTNIYAQNKTVKGRVIDEHLRALPYVLIMVADTIEVGKTDLNGFFRINIPIPAKRILFCDVGADLVSIELVDKCDEVEVVMILSSTYDFMSPRKVERLQLKKLKKLSETHRQAFRKGIFKTETACYERQYMPSFKKKSK